MLSTRVAITVLFLALASSGLLAQKQLAFTVTMSPVQGRDLATLKPEEVAVVENNQVLTINKVEVLDRVPKLQILIDNGIGFEAAHLGEVKDGIKAMVEALPDGIETTIITTAPNPRVLQAATTDKAKLVQAVGRYAPDQGSGKFTEALYEATERIEKDKTPNAAYTILTVAANQGDTNVREDDMKKIFDRVAKRQIPVYVVIYAPPSRNASAGPQQDIGGQAAGLGGGRMEVRSSEQQVAQLLPEVGKFLGTTLGTQTKQVRVIVDRPNGPKQLGDIGMQVLGANVLQMVLDPTLTK